MTRIPESVLIFALLLAGIMSLPAIVGALRLPDGGVYTGAAAFPTGAQVEYTSHLAAMWQGKRGDWAYQSLFTHETHAGLPFVEGFYIVLGKVAGLARLSLPAAFHISRFVATTGMVLAVWWFSAYFFVDEIQRLLGFIFGTVVVGWSWMLLLIAPGMTQLIAPIEFWLFEAFNLSGAFYAPHYAIAIILQIIVLLSVDQWIRMGHHKSFLFLTLALAAESIVQPDLIVLFVPLLLMVSIYHLRVSHLLASRRMLLLLIPFGVHISLSLYQILAIQDDPIWSNIAGQSQTPSPNGWYYLVAYLPFIIPIGFGARRFMLDEADDRWWMPILWVAVVAALVYGPFAAQRRFLLGVQLPLSILAAYGWQHGVLSRFSGSHRVLMTIGYAILGSTALLAMIGMNIRELRNPPDESGVFTSADVAQAYDWLRVSAQPDDLVLTTFDERGQGSGAWLVGATGHRVFVGHWGETANFQRKLRDVERFFDSSTSDLSRHDFLQRTGILYVWYDDSSRKYGDWNPSDANYLQRLFENDSVTIYQVNLSE